jgi:hypothetical protein
LLQADIKLGLADVATGEVRDFDRARIVERGRQIAADRLRAAQVSPHTP